MNYLILAALELTLLGLLSGAVGTLIVLRRRSFFAVALSHATFPGGVLFAVLGYQVLIGQAVFAVLLVLLLTALSRVPGQGRQVASGVVLAFGFALGSMLVSMFPAGSSDSAAAVPVEALLVGSPLTVNSGDVIATLVVLTASLLCLAVMWRSMLFQTFDPTGFEASGSKAWPIEFAASAIIAAGVVVAMPAVGAILGVAVLIGPAAAARLVATRIEWIPPLAALFGVSAGLAGLWASKQFALAAGGAVGLATTLVFIFALFWRKLSDSRAKEVPA